MGVFRELFVEVPQAILEASVKEAEAKCGVNLDGELVPPTPAAKMYVSAVDVLWPMLCELGERFGWEPLEWQRGALDHETRVAVRLKCRHVGRFYIHDEDLEDVVFDAAGVVDLIWTIFEQPPQRRCTCIEYIKPEPCTPGVCK